MPDRLCMGTRLSPRLLCSTSQNRSSPLQHTKDSIALSQIPYAARLLRHETVTVSHVLEDENGEEAARVLTPAAMCAVTVVSASLTLLLPFLVVTLDREVFFTF